MPIFKTSTGKYRVKNVKYKPGGGFKTRNEALTQLRAIQANKAK